MVLTLGCLQADDCPRRTYLALPLLAVIGFMTVHESENWVTEPILGCEVGNSVLWCLA